MGQPEPERFSDLTDVPPRLIPPVPPKTELFAKLVGNAFAIAVVGFAIAISLGKIFALRHGYRVDSNQVCDSDHVGTHRCTQAQMTGVREKGQAGLESDERERMGCLGQQPDTGGH